MHKVDEGGIEERTWVMMLVHIDVHVRARPIGVVGGVGRELNMLVQVGKKSAYIFNLRFCSTEIFYVSVIYFS